MESNENEPWTTSGSSCIEKMTPGTSQAVQWLRLCAPKAEGTGSVPGQGNKILHAMQCGLKKKRRWPPL